MSLYDYAATAGAVLLAAVILFGFGVFLAWLFAEKP